MYALSFLLIPNPPNLRPAVCRLLSNAPLHLKSSLHFYFLRLRSPGSSISAHFMILATSIGFSS